MSRVQRVEVLKPDWLHERDYRVAHRKTPDPRWWRIVDGLARPGPKHYEIVTFVPDEPFRFVGFDVEPASPFVVEDFNISGQTVPMRYPFSAVHLLPMRGRSVSVAASSMLIPPNESITLKLRNDRREAVPFTVRLLEPRDIR